MLVKIYGAARESEARYSPAECVGCERKEITGKPDRKHVSTSYVERQNLTIRMHMRRFTRLTNGFSKKIENHVAAIALHFMYYNFVRAHQTIRVTPAMAAGVSDRVWEVSDIVKLVDDYREARIREGQEKSKEARGAVVQSVRSCVGRRRIITDEIKKLQSLVKWGSSLYFQWFKLPS